MLQIRASLFFTALSVSYLCQAAEAITFNNAESSYHTLQQWYNQSIGLWIPSTVSASRALCGDID